jgi:hypothetical protein
MRSACGAPAGSPAGRYWLVVGDPVAGTVAEAGAAVADALVDVVVVGACDVVVVVV